jgi:sec-independent protein translocase protein TatA
MSFCFGFLMPGPTDMLIIGVIAVLLFGKRLPEVSRSVGKWILEAKKGLRGIEEELHRATYASIESSSSPSNVYQEAEDRQEATAPKFEPPPEEAKEAKSEPAQA